MPVRFNKNLLHDTGAPLSTEDAFRAFASFASLHNLLFDSIYEPSQSGWTIDDGTVLAIITIAARWNNNVSKWNDSRSSWMTGSGALNAPVVRGWNEGVSQWNDNTALWG